MLAIARLGIPGIGEAEWMTAVLAHVLGIAGASREKADAMSPKEARQGMPDLVLPSGGLEETVAAVARVFDETVARGHRRHTVSEQSAGVTDFLREASAACKTVGARGKHQWMAAAHAHVLVHAVPMGEANVGVMSQETRQRVAHVRRRSVLSQVLGAASAAPDPARGAAKHLVVNDVSPHRAAESHPQ